MFSRDVSVSIWTAVPDMRCKNENIKQQQAAGGIEIPSHISEACSLYRARVNVGP